MNKTLHYIDKLFYDALEKNTEPPRASAKERLMATLEKKDSESKRRVLIRVRMMALLLLFVLAGSVLTDPHVLKPGKAGKNEWIAAFPASKQVLKAPVPARHLTPEAGIGNHLWDAMRSNTALIAGGGSFYTHPFLGEKTEKQKPDAVPAPGLPESFLEFRETEINRMQPRPAAIEGRTRDKIPFMIQFPLPAATAFHSKKSPGNRFRPFWRLGLFSSYEQAGYRLDSEDPGVISNIKHNEAPEPSFSAGILLTRQFTPRWGLQTGLVYAHTAIGISPKKIYAFQDPAGDIAYRYVTSSGYTYIKPGFGPPPAFGDSLTAESKHNLKSVHVPLMLRYTAGKNKLRVSPAAGAEAAFIIRAQSEIELADAANHEKVLVNQLSGTKKVYVSAAASVDLEYSISKTTSISLQPVYRHALTPITENHVVETFPRSFGIRAGVTIRF